MNIANSLTKKQSPIAEFIWQDREIRFDMPAVQLKCRQGESIIDMITFVEDTKGNAGEMGSLCITNLRLIWFADKNQRVNLSVGYDCILSTEVKETQSAVKGPIMALFLRTRYQQSRYEFIFNSVVTNNLRMFQSYQAVIRSYETTKLYRDLKLRSAIIQDKQLVLLPNEKIFTKYLGVWNLSAEQGNLGTFVITDVRIVWYAQLSDNFNVSLPWVQLKCIRVRDSKYGTALVLETTEFSGSYVLGFRVEQLDEAFTEMSSLFSTFIKQPHFGVECTYEDASQSVATTIPIVEDQMQIVETGYESNVNAQRMRYQVGQRTTNEKPDLEFNEDLGLCCEKLPKGLDVD